MKWKVADAYALIIKVLIVIVVISFSGLVITGLVSVWLWAIYSELSAYWGRFATAIGATFVVSILLLTIILAITDGD